MDLGSLGLDLPRDLVDDPIGIKRCDAIRARKRYFASS